MGEVWKDVPNYEGFYQASNMGHIKSLRRINTRGASVPEKILKPVTKKTGYCNVNLSKNGVIKHYGVHRLIASAFLENPMKKPQVNHRNGIKTDNRSENLEWCTGSENILHSFENKLQLPTQGSLHGCAKLSESDVLEIRSLLIKKTPPVQVAKMFNISEKTVSQIKLRHRWKHI